MHVRVAGTEKVPEEPHGWESDAPETARKGGRSGESARGATRVGERCARDGEEDRERPKPPGMGRMLELMEYKRKSLLKKDANSRKSTRRQNWLEPPQRAQERDDNMEHIALWESRSLQGPRQPPRPN